MQNACRHFLGLYPSSKKSCAVGRDIRAWATRCNGGSETGIALRLPCTRQADDAGKPLFDCPQLDRKTQEQIDKERAEMSAYMDEILAMMGELQKMKRKMIKNGLHIAVATCPWCGAKDALKLSCAIEVNNHLHAKCAECARGFIE